MITDTELAIGVLKTAAIEFDVDAPEGGNPSSLTVECTVCGRMTMRKKRGRGNHRQAKCIECRNGKCSDCGTIFSSESTVREARKRGNVPRCQPCRFAFLRKGATSSKLTRTQLERRIAKLEAELKEAKEMGGSDGKAGRQ